MYKLLKNQSFTLVEILVVIAIIGLLAGIGVPVINGAMRKAKSGACLSNLRQIGTATLAYAADNSGLLPDGTDNNGSPVWASNLATLMSMDPTKKKNAFVCPGCAKPVGDAGANQIAVTYGFHGGLVPKGVPNTNRLSTVARPSQVILVADVCQDPANNGWSPYLIEEPAVIKSQSGGRGGTDLSLPISTANDVDSGENKWMRYRHDGKVNAVMCDGHAESFKKGTVLNRNVIFRE